jgi:imidazolonepropionase
MNIELHNISQLLTMRRAKLKDGRNLLPDDLDIISNAKIVYNKDKVLFVGSNNDSHSITIDKSINLQNHCVAPAYVDSHTHLVFGGDRSEEYIQKLNGVDYQVIADNGGGIVKTFTMTNQTPDNVLFSTACERINKMVKLGVKTIEIKSGYSGTLAGELKLSKMIHQLKNHFSPHVTIVNTFMAAHAVPKDFSSSSEFLNKVVIPCLEELAPLKIIDAIDIFHEKNYFTHDDVETLFKLAKNKNIPVKMHADEFNDNKGAQLAAKYHCLSADHLLCISDESIKILAKSEVVANLLPGTAFFLGKPQAPARALLDAGAKVAISSDFNPGSSHFYNLPLLASIAAPQYKMNICELWSAITINAANSLGIRDRGYLDINTSPFINIFQCNKIEDISYSWGDNLISNDFTIF